MSQNDPLPQSDELKKPVERAEEITEVPQQRPDAGILIVESEDLAQLYIEGFGLMLGKQSERVVVRKGKEVLAEVPFFRIQEICVASRGVAFSSDLIEAACRRGIRIAMMAQSEPVALVTSPFLTATVAIRKAQLEALQNGKGAEWCKQIVRTKIANQRQILYYFGKHIKESKPEEYPSLENVFKQLSSLAVRVRSLKYESGEDIFASLRGLEGTAGRLYWECVQKIVGEEFCGREHRGTQNAVNAMLNYGYGILYGVCWGAVMNAGLEPFAGFLHVDRPGKPSLVLDFIEEFRQPVVDRVVIAHFDRKEHCELTDGMLDQESRRILVTKIHKRLSASEVYGGKEYQTRSIIQMQARRLSRFLRNETGYRPYRFRI